MVWAAGLKAARIIYPVIALQFTRLKNWISHGTSIQKVALYNKHMFSRRPILWFAKARICCMGQLSGCEEEVHKVGVCTQHGFIRHKTYEQYSLVSDVKVSYLIRKTGEYLLTGYAQGNLDDL